MARTLPLVTCGFLGSHTNRNRSLSLPGKPTWSEEAALPYLSTNVAPVDGDADGCPAFTVYFPVDTVIAIGKNPDTTTGARYFVPAATERTFYCQPWDKLAAVAAI